MKPTDLANPQSDANLWVLIDDPENQHWKKINFDSGFMLAKLKMKTEKLAIPHELQIILKKSHFNFKTHTTDQSWSIVGCRNHFSADWIFLIHNAESFDEKKLIKVINDLHIKSVRFYGPFSPSASLKSSLKHFDIVSD